MTVNSGKCECIQCDSCKGNGIVFYTFGGRYIGYNRCDDLDSMESCDDCGGSGVYKMCENCQDMYEDVE